MRRLVIPLIAILLTGCSTAPITEQQAKHIPAERVYAQSLLSTGKAPGMGEVTFLRDKGATGSACDHHVYVDNVRAFSIRPGEGIRLSLEPGSHFFRLELGRGLCPNSAMSQEAIIAEGSDMAYRIAFEGISGVIRLVRVR